MASDTPSSAMALSTGATSYPRKILDYMEGFLVSKVRTHVLFLFIGSSMVVDWLFLCLVNGSIGQ